MRFCAGAARDVIPGPDQQETIVGLEEMAKDFLGTSEGQDLKNNALDQVEEAANKLTGGRFEDRINQGIDALSDALGGQPGDEQPSDPEGS